MMSTPSRLSNPIVRDRRPPTRRGGGSNEDVRDRAGGSTSSYSSAVPLHNNQHRRPPRAGPGFPRPPIAQAAPPLPPPIVRSSSSSTARASSTSSTLGGSSSSFELLSLTAGKSRQTRAGSDHISDRNGTATTDIPPGPAANKPGTVTKAAWATTVGTTTGSASSPRTTASEAVAAVDETNEPWKSASTTANHETMEEPFHLHSSGPQEPARNSDPLPLPLSPSDTNLPPVPPMPTPPQPPVQKPLRPQRPQRRRGCGGSGLAGTGTTTTTTTTSRADRDVESPHAAVEAPHPMDSVAVVAATPATIVYDSNVSEAFKDPEDRENPSVETTTAWIGMAELDDSDLCDQQSTPLTVPESVDTSTPNSSHLSTSAENSEDGENLLVGTPLELDRQTPSPAVPARLDISGRPTPLPRALPLAIFCCDPASPSIRSSWQVNIVPAHDDVPLTPHDYAALMGHVIVGSGGGGNADTINKDAAVLDKAQCILESATRQRVAGILERGTSASLATETRVDDA